MKKSWMSLLIGLVIVALLAMPMPASAQGGNTYSSGFQVQNLESGMVADIDLVFYTSAGAVAATISDTIAANSNKTYFPLTAVSSGFAGSVLVVSKNGARVSAIVNMVIYDGTSIRGGGSYSGFTAGSTSVSLPLLMKANYGIGTWFSVQNTSATSQTIAIDYTGGGLTAGQCDTTVDVAPYSAQIIDQTVSACLPNGWVGGAKLTGPSELAAVVIQVKTGAKSVWAYSGFTSNGTSFFVPLVSSNYYRSGTSINIQNVGASSTNVTVSYKPNVGFPGVACTETKAIAPGATAVFGFPQLPPACGSTAGFTGITDTTNGAFVGSATISANSASQNLVAIVNQVKRGAAEGASYNAFFASDAKNNISFPLVMDRNYGIFTGMSIVNVGSSSVTVNCSFSGSARTVSKTLAVGEGFTDVHLNAFTVGYVGAGFCAVADASAKIVGVMNQAKLGALDTEDQLLTYEGTNY